MIDHSPVVHYIADITVQKRFFWEVVLNLNYLNKLVQPSFRVPHARAFRGPMLAL